MKLYEKPLGQFADVIVLLLVCLLQFAFVFGMPWLDNGLWPQTEGPASAIHALSALLTLLVGLKVTFKDKKYLSATCSSVVASSFAFAIFAALLAPLTPEPIRSIQGTLKHGVGVIWQFEMAVVALASVALWQAPAYRRILAWSTAASTSSILALYVLPGQPFGVPLAFHEWTGMVAFAAAGLLVLYSKEASAPERAISLIAAAAIVGSGYLVSENRAVLLGLLVVAAYLGARHIPYLRAMVTIPAFRAASVVVVAVVLAAAVYVAGPLIEARSIASIKPSDYPTVVSAFPVDKANVQEGALGTIWSRSYMVRILVEDLVDHPATVLTGNGFGSFANAYEHYARDVPGRQFPNNQNAPSASTTFWDVHSSANFHSHNMLAETVTSVGIIGAIIWLAIFGAMAYRSVAGAAVSIGIIVVGSFWFPVNHMLGIYALLLASVASPRIPGKTGETALSGIAPLFAILGAAVIGYVAVASAILGIVERSERGFPGVEVNTNQNTCGFIRTQFFPEQEIVIDLYSVLRGRIMESPNPAGELFDHSTNVISINCMLRRYYEQDGSVRALTSSLSGRSALAAMGPSSFGALRNDLINWGNDLDLLLTLVPERTEYLPPYVAILGARAPEKALAEIGRFLPRLHDGDPVKFYLLAQQSKLSGDDAGYKSNLVRAMELGFANLWPVSQAEIRRVMAR